MRWTNALSQHADPETAVREVGSRVAEALDGRADLLIVFVAAAHRAHFAHIPEWLGEGLEIGTLAGCSGAGIIGDGRELEEKPAVAALAAQLPDATVSVQLLDDAHLPAEEDAAAWQQLVGVAPQERPSFVLLADPFSFEPRRCIAGLERAYPGAVIVGGLASGGDAPRQHALFLDDRVERYGGLLLTLHGDIEMAPIVAQGCRPVGQPMIVTSCADNVIYQLDNKPPGDVLSALLAELPEDDQALFRRALFMGIEMKDQREYRAGDFLVRNLLGLEPDGSALAIASEVRRWQVVQCHVRDAEASAADLRRCLQQSPRDSQAALMFSCLGRGEHLYGRPDHDSTVLREELGQLPLAGFFCNGEIGPVGGRTFMHGYTSSIGLLRPRG